MVRRRNPDREAGRLLTEIYREHAAGAYRYAYHLARSREDADDIVQAVFLALHQSLLRGETIVSPSAFLATAVKRRAINLAARRRADPDSAVVERTVSLTGTADAVAELARVQALLYTLPEAQHQAFVLRHWSGLSNREIAGVLATTEPAVESLLVRARAALMAAAAPDRECAGVCARLAEDRPVRVADAGHISTCRGCRTAQQRLTHASQVAAAAVLLPNVHVAHALAAAIPGFSASAASGAGASGGAVATAAGSKAGTAVLLAKTGAALVAVTAVTAVGIHAHSSTGSTHTAPAPHGTLAHTRRGPWATRAGETAVAATAAPSSQPDLRSGTDATRTTRHQEAAAKDGGDGANTSDTGATNGDANRGGDSNTGGGDTGSGSGDTTTTSGSDSSGSSGGNTDPTSAQSGDGGGSSGSDGSSGGSNSSDSGSTGN